MWPRERPTEFGPVPHAAANLGGDDDVLALDSEIAQGLADLNLGLAFGIDVGRVDEIDARFERAGDELGGGSLIERPNGAPESGAAVEGHRPKADFRDILARTAKRTIAHETSIPFWKTPCRWRGPIQPRAGRLRKSRFRDQRRAGAPSVIRESSRQAASASTGGAMAPVIIATASDIVTDFGSTTVKRRPRR